MKNAEYYTLDLCGSCYMCPLPECEDEKKRLRWDEDHDLKDDVHVVRCENCRIAEPVTGEDGRKTYSCKYSTVPLDGSHFCGFGKRKYSYE